MNPDSSEKAGATPHGNWSGRSRGGVFWIASFYLLMRAGGVRAAYVLAAMVVPWFLLTAPRAVRASQELRRRLGVTGLSFAGKIAWTYRHFYTFAKVLIDRTSLIHFGHENFTFTFDGEEALRATLNERRGAVLVTGHMGSFEAAAHILFRLNAPVHIVAFKGEAERMQRFLDRVFVNSHFKVIGLSGDAEDGLAIMSVLQRGEIVAILGDRNLSNNAEHSVELDFLGGRARFPTGPYLVAAIAGAPLIVGFAIRGGMRRYDFCAYPARTLKFTNRASRAEDVKRWAAEFAADLEQIVRRHPFQWRNFYSFWLTE
ncbi:hypothetical protein BH09SUM1_BH09SUM1_18750 [soil metagenome]